MINTNWLNLINWCNDNQGFLSAILSFFTIIISSIAIRFSIQSSKKQNKIALYNARYNVYLKLKEISLNVIKQEVPAETIFQEINYIKDEVFFLFNQDIRDYLLKIINNVYELNLFDGHGNKVINLKTHETKFSEDEFQSLKKDLLKQLEKKELRLLFLKYIGLNSIN